MDMITMVAVKPLNAINVVQWFPAAVAGYPTEKGPKTSPDTGEVSRHGCVIVCQGVMGSVRDQSQTDLQPVHLPAVKSSMLIPFKLGLIPVIRRRLIRQESRPQHPHFFDQWPGPLPNAIVDQGFRHDCLLFGRSLQPVGIRTDGCRLFQQSLWFAPHRARLH